MWLWTPVFAHLVGAAVSVLVLTFLAKGWSLEASSYLHVIIVTFASTLGVCLAVLYVQQRHRKIEKHLKTTSRTDLLTGLPNREAFDVELERVLAQARRYGRICGLIFIDLDGLKETNDDLGHEVGDCLIVAAGERIASVIRQGDMAVRFGGDEFAVILPEVASSEATQEVGERIVNAIGASLVYKNQPLPLSASVGFALYPENATRPQDLYRQADQAMYQAKKLGGNRCVGAVGTMRNNRHEPAPLTT